MRNVRRNDPKMLKLRAERENAQMRLDILCKGIGHVLADGYAHDINSLQPIIDQVNTDLVRAANEAETAEEAYRPYWRRRMSRVRLIKSTPAKKKSK